MYVGYINEKNFVGLSINVDGYIVCGLEDNIVYVYAKYVFFFVAYYGFVDKSTSMLYNRCDKGGFILFVVWFLNFKYFFVVNFCGYLKIFFFNKVS